MRKYTLDELLLENRPDQFLLLDDLLRLVSQSPHLTHAFVRGSIAKNTFDRASDLDMVLAFESAVYPDFIGSLDRLLAEHFNVLFPGWHDAIVTNFGGLGFVYLIERHEQLFQADIYVIPEDKAANLPNLTKTKLIYERSCSGISRPEPLASTKKFIEAFSPPSPVNERYLIEVLILAFLIQKRLKRSQQFLNYSETHLLNNAIRGYVRAVYDAEHVDYGWYHIEEQLAKAAAPTALLEFLKQLILGKPVHDHQSLRATVMSFLEIAREANPKVLERYGQSIPFYLKKCGFL